MDANAYCADQARRFDRDRFLCTLFAPPAARPALHALLAFNLEVGNIPATTSEPLIGLMRLQWWRDVLDTVFQGGAAPAGSPVAEALAAAVRRHAPPAALFDDILEARSEALDREPLADERALERRVAADVAVATLSLRILGLDDAASDSAARHVGLAWGMLGLGRAMPYRAQSGWHPFPQSWQAEAEMEQGAAVADAPDLRAVLTRRLADAVTDHLSKARLADAPRAAAPALLPATLADAYLRRLRRNGFDLFDAGLRAAGSGALFLVALRSFIGRY